MHVEMLFNWRLFAYLTFFVAFACLLCSASGDVEIANNQTTSNVTSSSMEKTLNQVNKLLNQSESDHSIKPKVILILADGVRWDYVNDASLVNFERMRKRGAKAEYVQPIFPSYSYPNWYTIVTGLYAESHGMVQNFMYDEEHNETFYMSPHPDASHSFWWNQSEPIWVTAEKNGFRTSMQWWDGCQVNIENVKITSCTEYRSYFSWPNPKQDTIDHLNNVLNRFKKDELDLALVYYEAVDSIGHAWGPDSNERKDAMKDLDDIMGKLMDSIDGKKLTNQVSVVLVSDHGMLGVDQEKVEKIDLEKILKVDDIDRMLERGPLSAIYPKPGKMQKVLSDLKAANVKGLKFYERDQIPIQYHYRNNKRIGPIFLIAEKGHYILGFRDRRITIPAWNLVYPGHHGYDPYVVEEMRAIMFAYGPKIKSDYVNPPMMMTDHYNLVCDLLGLQANPNNGSWNRVSGMVLDSKQNVTSSSFNLFNSYALVGLITLLTALTQLRQVRL